MFFMLGSFSFALQCLFSQKKISPVSPEMKKIGGNNRRRLRIIRCCAPSYIKVQVTYPIVPRTYRAWPIGSRYRSHFQADVLPTLALHQMDPSVVRAGGPPTIESTRH